MSLCNIVSLPCQVVPWVLSPSSIDCHSARGWLPWFIVDFTTPLLNPLCVTVLSCFRHEEIAIAFRYDGREEPSDMLVSMQEDCPQASSDQS